MPDKVSLAQLGQRADTHDAVCPTQHATAERILSFVKPGDQVLELGGGDGRLAMDIAPHVDSYICSDAAEDLVSVAAARTRSLGNVRCLSLGTEDASLPRNQDIVLGIDLLHLLDDVPRALQRMHWLLRPGGLLITRTVTVAGPTQALKLPDLLRRMMGRKPHMSMVTSAALERMVRTAGFEVVSCDMVPRYSRNCMIVARARPSSGEATGEGAERL